MMMVHMITLRTMTEEYRSVMNDDYSNGGDDDKDTSLCHPLIWKTKDLKMRPDRFVWTAHSTGWQQMLPVLEQLEFYQILQKCISWINSKNISIIQIWRELLQPDWGSCPMSMKQNIHIKNSPWKCYQENMTKCKYFLICQLSAPHYW